ncbi:S9 family peptidase, partial [Paenibacillus sp. EKM208P]
MSDPQSSTTKRCITAEDLYRLHWVSDPAIHPLSSEIAYVEQHINKERTDYNSGIWLLSPEGANAVPFTYGP